jgi:asparagine synthetase B (glutamine-hydrolysing)
VLSLNLKVIGFDRKQTSEVVLNALVEWGQKALNKFNGMFAIALWDKKERTLLLARDRYGNQATLCLSTRRHTLLLALSKRQFYLYLISCVV